jgi:hypothetical protein
MWQTIFPCFQILFNDSTQQRRQSDNSLKRLALSLVIGPLGSDKGSYATSAPFPCV